jgi:hypothetical protein
MGHYINWYRVIKKIGIISYLMLLTFNAFSAILLALFFQMITYYECQLIFKAPI